MSNSTYRSIAPKPSNLQEVFAQNPNVLAVATSTSSAPTFAPILTTNLSSFTSPLASTSASSLVPAPAPPLTSSLTLQPPLPNQKETQLVEPTSAFTKPNKKGEKPSKKKNTSQSATVEGDTGWGDDNTKLLLNFLEENFASYKKNKSNFAKKVSAQLFPGKSWEQIKNKLSRLITKYNEIKEKKNQTGEAAQARWKWFERIDMLFGTRDNHNPGFLVDGFSNDTEFFNNIEEKENEEKKEVKEESSRKCQGIKKKKPFSQDPLAEAILSMSNAKQVILEKRLDFESEQSEKKRKIEKKIREAEMNLKKEELEIERIRADTLQKKMEFEIEQTRMEFQLRMKELDLKMMQFKSPSE